MQLCMIIKFLHCLHTYICMCCSNRNFDLLVGLFMWTNLAVILCILFQGKIRIQMISLQDAYSPIFMEGTQLQCVSAATVALHFHRVHFASVNIASFLFPQPNSLIFKDKKLNIGQAIRKQVSDY